MTEPIGQYIQARMIKVTTKTNVWVIENKKSEIQLGIVKWNTSWRRYCFFPLPETVFSGGCLNDITTFLDNANKKYKEDRIKK